MEGHDIAAITSIDSDNDSGSIYVASTSVIDAQVPCKSRKKRAHTEMQGWVFTPTGRNDNMSHSNSRLNVCSEDPHGEPEKSVKVTFICHLPHLQGPVPMRVARILADETLGCIGRLQAYLHTYGCPPYVRRVAGKVLNEKFDCMGPHYQLTFIAKHEPSKRRKDKAWCTEVIVHPSAYRHGFNIAVSPAEGTRTERVTDDCILIFTTQHNMDGKHIRLDVRPNPSDHKKRGTSHSFASSVTLPSVFTAEPIRVESQPDITDDTISNPANTTVETRISADTSIHFDTLPSSTDVKKTTTPSSQVNCSSIASSTFSTATQLIPPLSPSHTADNTNTLQIPKGYVLVPEQHYQASGLL